jgi:hypothetical protein
VHLLPAKVVSDRYVELYAQCTAQAKELADMSLVGSRGGLWVFTVKLQF